MTAYKNALERAEKKLEKLLKEQEQLNRNAIPGGFATGRSGISAARYKRLARQLDKTIDLSVAIVKAQKRVDELRRKRRLFLEGKIHANGRPVQAKSPEKPRNTNAIKKEIDRHMLALDIDGKTEIDGHIIGVYVTFDGNYPVGIIRETLPDGTVINHRAVSVQGFDLWKTQVEVIKTIIKKRGELCSTK